jgi:hypothetical protein
VSVALGVAIRGERLGTGMLVGFCSSSSDRGLRPALGPAITQLGHTASTLIPRHRYSLHSARRKCSTNAFEAL